MPSKVPHTDTIRHEHRKRQWVRNRTSQARIRRWSHLMLLFVLCWSARRGALVASITTPSRPWRHLSGSRMTLFGFRERFFSTTSGSKWQQEELPMMAPCSDHYSSSVLAPAAVVPDLPEQQPVVHHTAPSSKTTAVRSLSKILRSDNPDAWLFTLPPVDRNQLTSLAREFRDMVLEYSNFTEREVLSISDLHSRTILDGVVASAQDPAIYRAFEVAFEDLYPLRLAGRVIHSKLKQSLRDGQLERDRQVEQVRQATALDRLDETQLVFAAIAVPLNGKAYLTRAQLEQTGLTDLAVHTLGFNSTNELMERIDPHNKSHIDFAQLMMGLHECAVQVCQTHQCHAPTIVQELMMELVDHPPTIAVSRDTNRQRYIERFDHMVSTFRGWKSLVPTGKHGRIMDVINGCFVGAENEPVLQALRVCYVDYAGLRLAGDIIFKLSASILNARQRHSSSQE